MLPKTNFYVVNMGST